LTKRTQNPRLFRVSAARFRSQLLRTCDCDPPVDSRLHCVCCMSSHLFPEVWRSRLCGGIIVESTCFMQLAFQLISLCDGVCHGTSTLIMISYNCPSPQAFRQIQGKDRLNRLRFPRFVLGDDVLNPATVRIQVNHTT